MAHQDRFSVYVNKNKKAQEFIDFELAVRMLNGRESLIKHIFYKDGKKLVDKKYVEDLVELNTKE